MTIAGGIAKNQYRTPYKRVAYLGWVLYAVSWVTPSLNGDWVGAHAFVASIRYGMAHVFQPHSVPGFALGVCLVFGWLANLSIVIPMRSPVRKVWMAAPWVAFVALLLLPPVPWAVREAVISQFYFYPWAIGIALIHGSKAAQCAHSSFRS